MIDRAVARKVLEVVDAGLCSGVGNPIPGEMCVEAAVCYALGEPHGDKPLCVAPEDRSFKIRLNDACWSSKAARARGLRRVSVMQLGTKGTDRTEWLRILAELTIRRILPEAAEAASKLSPAHADALRAAGRSCAEDGTHEAALALRAAAAYAAADYVADAAAYAAAAYYADAAGYDVAYAAADVAYAAADAADERDRILTISARCAEEAYERTGSLGVDLLRQIETEDEK